MAEHALAPSPKMRLDCSWVATATTVAAPRTIGRAPQARYECEKAQIHEKRRDAGNMPSPFWQTATGMSTVRRLLWTRGAQP